MMSSKFLQQIEESAELQGLDNILLGETLDDETIEMIKLCQEPVLRSKLQNNELNDLSDYLETDEVA